MRRPCIYDCLAKSKLPLRLRLHPRQASMGPPLLITDLADGYMPAEPALAACNASLTLTACSALPPRSLTAIRPNPFRALDRLANL